MADDLPGDTQYPPPQGVDTAVPRQLPPSYWAPLLFAPTPARIAWAWCLVTTLGLWLDLATRPPAPLGGAAPFDLEVLVFPGVGVGLVLASVALALHRARWIRHGYLARATLVEVSGTPLRVGSGPHHQISGRQLRWLTFEFHDHHRRHRAVSVLTPALQGAEAGDETTLFYSPDEPSRVLLLAALPAGLQPLPRGALIYSEGLHGWGLWVLPILTLCVNVLGPARVALQLLSGASG